MFLATGQYLVCDSVSGQWEHLLLSRRVQVGASILEEGMYSIDDELNSSSKVLEFG